MTWPPVRAKNSRARVMVTLPLRPAGKLACIETVTVASMNLHCGLGPRGEPFDVASVICGLDATVICLQEAWLSRAAMGTSLSAASPSQLAAGRPTARPGVTASQSAAAAGAPAPVDDPVAAAAAALGRTLYRVSLRPVLDRDGSGSPADSSRGDVCIAVLTALPVTSYQVCDLGRAPGDGAPRRGQVLRLKLPDGSALRVCNTHLTHRFLSPAQLGLLLWHLRRESRAAAPEPTPPTLIAGDFNMPRVLAALTPGFSPTARGRTWPAWQPLIQLDHILISSGLRVAGSSVLPAAGSDHLGIRAALTVADTPLSRPRWRTARRRAWARPANPGGRRTRARSANPGAAREPRRGLTLYAHSCEIAQRKSAS